MGNNPLNGYLPSFIRKFRLPQISMRFCLLFILSIILQTGASFGQSKADSLISLLPSSKPDSSRARLLNTISRELKAQADNKRSLEFGNQALEVSLSIKNSYWIASSYNNIGMAFSGMGRHDTAFTIFSKAIELSNQFRDPKLEAHLLNNLGLALAEKGQRDKALEFYERSLKLRESIGDKEGIGSTYNNIGNVYVGLGQYDKALIFLKKSLLIREALGDKKLIAAAYHNIANTYYGIADYPKAMENYLRSLKIRREVNDKAGIGSTLNNIAGISRLEKDYKNALAYYTESMKIREETGNKQGVAIALNNIGNIYFDLNEMDKALEFFSRSLEIRKELNDKKGQAIVLSNIGASYKNMSDFPKALKHHLEALKLQEQMEDDINIAITYNNIGEAYLGMNNFSKAIEYGLKSFEITSGKKAILEQRLSVNLLYEAYKNSGDITKALSYHEKLLQLNDSLYNTEKTTKVNMLKTQFALDQQETELKAQAKSEKEKIQAVALAEKKKQRIVIYAVGSGLVMLLFFSAFLFNRFQVIRKQNGIIESQKLIVEEKNRDITDSINYAKRIQTAILAPRDQIASGIKDHFVLFKPKDIVSGDFYYFAQKNEKLLVAVADCTGHGVPGAFMSVIGNNVLDQIINEKGVTKPSQILAELHAGVRSILNQENSDSESRDGMDIALCAFDPVSNTVEYSGAMRNLYVVKGNGELKEVISDKQSIGGIGPVRKEFTNHALSLESGDSIYILSDGYADQFGGPSGKKFMTRRLKDLLVSLSAKGMKDQEKILDREFITWKGNLEQVDDICVIGMRV